MSIQGKFDKLRQLMRFDPAAFDGIENVMVADNGLPAAQIDRLIVQMNEAGFSGKAYLNGNEPPTDASAAALREIRARGGVVKLEK